MMHKYHNLGTAENVVVLNEIKALPFRNLQRTSDPAAAGISGEAFAEKTLLRNAACAGCPVGCIHLGFVREKFMDPNQYLYRQVSYDHEPIFAVGCMLAVTDPFAALSLMEEAERGGAGRDVGRGGARLGDRGLRERIDRRRPRPWCRCVSVTPPPTARPCGTSRRAKTSSTRCSAAGPCSAARRYGGEDFACVLGQEMAGYATGEVFFVSQALGLRHSHLDAGGYSFDQKQKEKDVAKAVDFLLADESSRCFLTSMVACLFARGVYTEARLAEALAGRGLRRASPGRSARCPSTSSASAGGCGWRRASVRRASRSPSASGRSSPGRGRSMRTT